jgi:hypothetical protein
MAGRNHEQSDCVSAIRHAGTRDLFSTRLVEACSMVVYISHVMECR